LHPARQPRVSHESATSQPRDSHIVDHVREELDQLGHDNRLTTGPPLQPTLSPRGRRPIFRGGGHDGYPSHMPVAGMRWIALAVTAELSPGALIRPSHRMPNRLAVR
jgi:hypothetical protein